MRELTNEALPNKQSSCFFELAHKVCSYLFQSLQKDSSAKLLSEELLLRALQSGEIPGAPQLFVCIAALGLVQI